MEVSIWDTYVHKKDGEIMHFDIVVPSNVTDETLVYEMGKEYLQSKGQEGQELSTEECRFCHKEIASEEVKASIAQKGFYIIEMEGCDD